MTRPLTLVQQWILNELADVWTTWRRFGSARHRRDRASYLGLESFEYWMRRVNRTDNW